MKYKMELKKSLFLIILFLFEFFVCRVVYFSIKPGTAVTRSTLFRDRKIGFKNHIVTELFAVWKVENTIGVIVGAETKAFSNSGQVILAPGLWIIANFYCLSLTWWRILSDSYNNFLSLSVPFWVSNIIFLLLVVTLKFAERKSVAVSFMPRFS